MQKYELIRERFTTCSGDRHPQTTMEELTIPDPESYVQNLFQMEKHLQIQQHQTDSSLVFDVYTSGIHQLHRTVIPRNTDSAGTLGSTENIPQPRREWS